MNIWKVILDKKPELLTQNGEWYYSEMHAVVDYNLTSMTTIYLAFFMTSYCSGLAC